MTLAIRGALLHHDPVQASDGLVERFARLLKAFHPTQSKKVSQTKRFHRSRQGCSRQAIWMTNRPGAFFPMPRERYCAEPVSFLKGSRSWGLAAQYHRGAGAPALSVVAEPGTVALTRIEPVRVNSGIIGRLRHIFGGGRGKRARMATTSLETVVDVIFQAALARAPDSQALATYSDAMRSGAMLPIDVFRDVKNSNEGHQARTLDCTSLIVPAMYEALLGRPSTQDEVMQWRQRARVSGGIDQVVRDILAMPETARAQLNNAIGSQGMQALFLAEYRRAGLINA